MRFNSLNKNKFFYDVCWHDLWLWWNRIGGWCVTGPLMAFPMSLHHGRPTTRSVLLRVCNRDHLQKIFLQVYEKRELLSPHDLHREKNVPTFQKVPPTPPSLRCQPFAWFAGKKMVRRCLERDGPWRAYAMMNNMPIVALLCWAYVWHHDGRSQMKPCSWLSGWTTSLAALFWALIDQKRSH